MKVMVILPTERASYPPEEIEDRRSSLQKLVSPGTELVIGFRQGGSCFKGELTAEDFELDEEIVGPAREAEQAGYDAVLVYCVYDPGVASARKQLKMPVVGPGQASLIFSGILVEKFGILAPADTLVKKIHEMVSKYQLAEKVTSVRAINIPLPQLKDRHADLRKRAIELGKKAIQEGAELILPFGMAVIPAHLSCKELEQELGVPVINPAEVGLRFTELAATVRKRSKAGEAGMA